ncbi:unnamed protein product [[Candida] boidinii]|uniref:Unnamed protein product n=1 Tax=Candida boidinii TaxID=5477 RepID=A0A9W6WFW2_CANBO|nr:transferase activity protein [[Candida] boidinii]GME68570.1 unnamed protein product [[Candida] boidinii]GMF98042.1 unnamed protein product [[Candida] boidinii]
MLVDEHDPKMEPIEAPYIKLYTSGTPNGQKISILLELLHLDYKLRSINIYENEQKQDWFLNINPNGRIPTLSVVDSDGKIKYISESGAIMLYLADKYDTENRISYKFGTDLYYEQLEWLMFQMGGIGPMMGQAHHFNIFAPKRIPYAENRYKKESGRLMDVLEKRLEINCTGFLVGDHVCIADLAIYPWLKELYCVPLNIDEWPLVSKWVANMDSIPEISKGMTKH